jgi:hypothetical protein
MTPLSSALTRTRQVLLITYDLRTPGRDYKPFYEVLKQQGAWWHYIPSSWLVATTKSVQDVYTALGQHLSQQDFILVVPVRKPAFGYLPKGAWDWINANVPL